MNTIKKHGKILYFFGLIALIFQIYGCVGGNDSNSIKQGKEYKKLSPNRPNLNLSIMLDLSDRISTSAHANQVMEFYLRDIGYINSIANAFVTHCMNKKMIMMNDKMQVFMDPPPSNAKINELISQLKIDVNKNTITNEYLLNIESKYDSIINEIYIQSINKSDYPGSDIWRFFNSRIKDYCIIEGFQNVLILLTDGYIYHENTVKSEGNRTSYLLSKTINQLNLTNSNWKKIFEQNDLGFIQANTDLNNIDILVLNVNPNNSNPYEEEVVKKYWNKWLTEMGVKKFEIKTTDLPANLHEYIQNFIWKE